MIRWTRSATLMRVEPLTTTPEAPRRPSPVIGVAALAGFLVLALVAIVAYNAGKSSRPAATAAPVQTVTVVVTTPVPAPVTYSPEPPPPPATTAAAPAGPATSFGDGQYEVGKDIAPGTYKTTVPGSNCYWARSRDLSGDTSAIIANNNVSSGGKVTVTIKSSDKGFVSDGCGTWTKSG